MIELRKGEKTHERMIELRERSGRPMERMIELRERVKDL